MKYHRHRRKVSQCCGLGVNIHDPMTGAARGIGAAIAERLTSDGGRCRQLLPLSMIPTFGVPFWIVLHIISLIKLGDPQAAVEEAAE